MSYSDRESSGGSSAVGIAGGVGSVLLIILLIGVRVTLKAMARASRNADYSNSQNDGYASTSGLSLPETQRNAGVRQYDPVTMSPITAEELRIQDEWLRQQQAQRQAEEAARSQQRAELAAQQAQRFEAERAQREADNAARRAQFEAERQAREQERQNQMAAARNNPAPFVPPAAPFVPPGAPQGAPPPDVNQVPGFEVTDLAQVKPRDSVYVNADGQWLPAMVQAKRGRLIQVRSASGVVATVTLDRLRSEKEPLAKVDSGVPAALRSVAQNSGGKRKDEPEDDALFVAKPKKDDEEIATPAPIEASSSPVAPAVRGPEPIVRTWTNNTGEFKVDAELVGFEFSLVQLKRKDGKVISLPIENLSTADQAVVRETYK